MLVLLVVALVVLVVGQMIWVQHQNDKLNAYQGLFVAYLDEFMRVFRDGLSDPKTLAYLDSCIKNEQACVAAQTAVMRERITWPWRWLSRWNADYFHEATSRA